MYISKTADFSASSLGKNIAATLGFPNDPAQGADLLGLYLFNEGSIGSPFTGPFLDSSGNGNHATIVSGRVAPIRRASGMEIGGNGDLDGLILNTQIPTARTAHTAIIGSQMISAAATTDAASSNLSHHLFGSTQGAGTKTSSHLNNNASAFGWIVKNNRATLYDPLHRILTSPTVRQNLSPAGGGKGDNVVMARRVDGPNGTVLFKTFGAEFSTSDAANANTTIEDGWDGTDSGNFALGAWPFSTIRPTVGPNVLLYFAAIYGGALSDALLSSAMLAGARIMQGRGLTVHGL